MNKKQFTKAMRELMELNKIEDRINKSLKPLNPDFNFISFERYESLVMDTLVVAMNDKHEWIYYWMYELDYGKEHKRLTVKDSNGKIVPMKTISDLYNVINNKNI